MLCNDAQLSGPSESAPGWHPIGDPTEVALLTLAIRAVVVPDELRTRSPRRDELPFDATEQRMATHTVTASTRAWYEGRRRRVLALCTHRR